MKKIITSTLVKVTTILLTAIVCSVLYYVTDLISLFGVNITFLQWIGITIISYLLFSNTITPNSPNKNDTKGPKIS